MKNKLEIDLEDLVNEKVYKVLMDKHWLKIEQFKQSMQDEILESTNVVARKITKELMKQVNDLKESER